MHHVSVSLRLHFHFNRLVCLRPGEDAPKVALARGTEPPACGCVPIPAQKEGGRSYIVSIQRLGVGGAGPGAARR